MALETPTDVRPVLQPACNRVPTQESRKQVEKSQPKLTSSAPSAVTNLTFPAKKPAPRTSQCKPTKPSPPISPKSKPLASLTMLKRASANDPHSLNLSIDKQCAATNFANVSINAATSSNKLLRGRKKSRPSSNGGEASYDSSILIKYPGSIAAARREQASLLQAQRKQRIAHYGRMPKPGAKVVPEEPPTPTSQAQEQKRCSFITPNSDPIYVRYHDEEWGVPVHEDKMLFELLVLAGAQVGLDWTTILKMRDAFREAFDGFDAESINNFTEKRIASISSQLHMDVLKVRGVVDNSKRLIEIKREFGSFDNYIWGFLNHKPMCPDYRSWRKVPVKTSKSESISKDMVRRKFRYVGPTVIHSFMQAAGLTNDHLITCPCHTHCMSMAAAAPSNVSSQ
ncbi:putative GMP synthase glutamine-hydrolyzing [Nymphaea thermarum]|nr:putative GMP synthase glutamine-hydrolyzing [Nymphaea thermarum]